MVVVAFVAFVAVCVNQQKNKNTINSTDPFSDFKVIFTHWLGAQRTATRMPAGSEQQEKEEDDDDDLFATLGVAGPAVALSSSGEEDILSAFMDDDEEESIEPEATSPEPTPKPTPKTQANAKESYRMVLETVWVDGILDPGEVNLLARKREDLGISFEEHLALVREMLG